MNTINIEVVQKQKSSAGKVTIMHLCEEYLQLKEIMPGAILAGFDDSLSDHVENIIIGDGDDVKKLDISKTSIKWFIYKLDPLGPQMETMQPEGEQEIVPLATHWLLPSKEFHGLWENLIYDSNIKGNLLRYVHTTMLFADKGANETIICSNKVVLLHGPPGTGKTSLCKALAHKLTCRLQHRYLFGQLIEINSHSLFSKWFSESGKLVNSMFSKIREFVENPKALICILIDEIESLAHERKQCMSGTEPSDSIRVVNAVLTQLDQIKRYPNVLILTTSNMTEAIDIAFIDRADIKQYIGLPSSHAIYQIYYTSLKELMRIEIIYPADTLLTVQALNEPNFEEYCLCENSIQLKKLSDISVGLSGRTLRKVPFVAHALFLKSDSATITNFLEAMGKAVIHLKEERLHFDNYDFDHSDIHSKKHADRNE